MRTGALLLATLLLAGCSAPSAPDDPRMWSVSGHQPGLFALLNASASESVHRHAVGAGDPLQAENVRAALGPYVVSLVARDHADGTHFEWMPGPFRDGEWHVERDVVFARVPNNVSDEALREHSRAFFDALADADADTIARAVDAFVEGRAANVTPAERTITLPQGGEVHAIGDPEAQVILPLPGAPALADAFASLGGLGVPAERMAVDASAFAASRSVELDGWSFSLSMPSISVDLEYLDQGAQLRVDPRDQVDGAVFVAGNETAARDRLRALLDVHGLDGVAVDGLRFE